MLTDFIDDDSDAAVINKQVHARVKSLKRILQSVRNEQTLVTTLIDREMRRTRAVSRVITETTTLNEADRVELMSRTENVFLALEFLKSWSLQFAPLTLHHAGIILGRGRFVGNSPEEKLIHYQERIELLLQARPNNKNFWDLARTLTNDIDDALRTFGRAYGPRLRQYKAVIQCVAPAFVFEDRTHIRTPTRYGNLTTGVTSVVVSGPPGSGKRG